MPYTVLIVEDSNFFQSRLKEIINENAELEVVGVAANGKEAVEMTAKLKPDVISMDYEMPTMDGITAIKLIMAETPTPIVMFSSMTYEGARITLDALDAGAVDFMNKNFAEVSANSTVFKRKFYEKLLMFARNGKVGRGRASAKSALLQEDYRRLAPAVAVPTPVASFRSTSVEKMPLAPRPIATKPLKGRVKLVVIGASTGGPVAVADIIAALPANFPAPIVIIQHMPENFTKAFAERLNRNSALTVKEAEAGDRLEQGLVLVAPGGKQLMFDRGGKTIKVIAGDDRVSFRPCVDITFASAATAFGDGVLALVLTGMGSDGCDGARLLHAKGSIIWSQDKASCVVYGMPSAVAKENLTHCEMSLKDIAKKLISDL